MTPRIAVCITTRNRPEVFADTLAHHKAMLPEGAMLIVVDDASDAPVQWADYRFKQNAGIARAKNKCLELACKWEAEHIFLFDDDTYPVMQGWWKPYVNSKEPHLMYIFNPTATGKGHALKPRHEVYRDPQTVAYDHTRGCMLYLERRVLDVVGGFDVAFGKGMIEHRDYTDRIHRAGLTSFRVMDVPDSGKLIYCLDQVGGVESTISSLERTHLLQRSKQLRQANANNAELYREFREVV